jgi:hypothetical protein
MSPRTKLIAGAVVIASVAAAGAAFAAVELTRTTTATATPPMPFSGLDTSGLGDGRLGGRGFGGGLGSGRGFVRWRIFADFSAAASYLGLPAATLRNDLEGGRTLAQIAKAHGKPVDGLVAAVVGAQKRRLDAAVSNGFLTHAQATRLVSSMQRRVEAMVERPRSKR